jgi:hypothetical protein
MNALFEQLEQTLSPVLAGLDGHQTQLRPTAHPDKWTIQQIVEHLLLSYASTRQVMEARIARGKPTQAHPSLVQRFAQFCVTNLSYFPEGRQAPAVVDPPPSIEPLSGPQLIQSVHQQLSGIDPLFDQAEAVFGPRQAVTHHVLGPLSIHQWRRFHLIHGRHHAKQIAAIRRQHGL